MLITYTIALFMDSRKRGTSTARKKCSDKTITAYEWNFKIFTDWLGTYSDGVVEYKDLKRTTLGQFLDWLATKEKSGEYSRSTSLQILRTLKAYFRWVDDDEDCKEAGLRGLQKFLPRLEQAPRRTDIPSLKDMRLFKNTWNTSKLTGFRDYVATCLMLGTGMRLGEVCDLKLQDVQLDERLLEFRAKGGKRRKVALPREVVPLLRSWIKKRQRFKRSEGSEYVFVSKYQPKMDVSSWGSRFRQHRLKYNLPRITAHTMRHLFATTYLKNDGNIKKLQMMMGHETLDMILRYSDDAQLAGKPLQDELDRVNPLKEL